MLFKTKNKSTAHQTPIEIDGVAINQVSSTKFLGVIINENLTWSNHIEVIKQKVRKSTGIICKIRYCLPQNVLHLLYFALIHPYFDYCNIIWGIDRTILFKQLFASQKRVVWIINFCKLNEPWTPLFNNLQILPLHRINDLQVGCFVYRCINNQLSSQFTSMFVSNACVHDYCTRQRNNLHAKYSRLNIQKNSVRIAGVLLWNSIPVDIRSASTHILFRKYYKLYIFKLLQQ